MRKHFHVLWFHSHRFVIIQITQITHYVTNPLQMSEPLVWKNCSNISLIRRQTRGEENLDLEVSLLASEMSAKLREEI